MAKRIDKEGGDDKIVRREVASIYSLGTFHQRQIDVKSNVIEYDTKYILTYCQQDQTHFGFCYFDFSTLKFYIGQFIDDMTLKQFRTLCLQIRPVETIVPSTFMFTKDKQA